MEQRIDTIVFDLGGVLVDWDPRHLYRGEFEDEAAMEEFLATVTTPAWNLELDGGRSFAEGVRALVAEHPRHEALIRAYHERWPEMLRDPILGTVEILAELRAVEVPCYALTNWSAETFPHARERFEFLSTFDGVVVSGEERAVKPDPALFAVLEQRFGVEPARTVFIDDSATNVAGAAARGYATVHFTGPEDLRARLATLGLPVTTEPGGGRNDTTG